MVQRQQEQSALKQEDAHQALQTIRSGSSLSSHIRLVYPDWPTSRPGPCSTPPPPGMKPINALRPEQVKEIDHSRETPSVQSPFHAQSDAQSSEGQSSDQAPTAQEALHRRKKRL